ncbi:efflux RND transporter periplasmic adaptor subunit [Reyranella sp.]|uniref:efflux RND transporter periplasmic adaptor subunit n=1 Tax=Reyranella sp. TaxID=1929291 RepID=UPI003BA8F0B2
MCLDYLRPFERKTRAMRVAALAVAGALVMTGPTRAQAPSPQAGGPGGTLMPVITAAAAERTVPIHLRSVGTAVASRTTVVRSAVGGKLTEIDFTAGQRVVAGDLLARVDSRAAQARLDRDIAIRDRDQARAETAGGQKTLVRRLEQATEADETRVSRARAARDATDIRAPTSGTVGGALRRVGDMVQPDDETGIVVISRTEPMSVVFTLPQTIARAVREKLLKGSLAVEAYGHDKLTPLAEGRLLRDNQKNRESPDGDELVAMFPNPDHALSPGMRVEVQLRGDGTRTALAIPMAAVRRSPAGYYTYIVTQSGTAHVRPIALGTVADEFVVVREGLRPGDVIVTDGQDQLAEGSRVAIVAGPSPRRPPE